MLAPCYNEEATISQVVTDFARALPGAAIWVFDNNSTDDTAAIAEAAGARVRHTPLRGKGNVVRRMFSDVEADIYLLVDGDHTYDATAAPMMVRRPPRTAAMITFTPTATMRVGWRGTRPVRR